MLPIYLPEHVDIKEEAGNTTTFAIYPYHPGYGPTVANALRRVLLSSLPGSAITHVKIDEVSHEYSAIDGVKEDVISILLNLKRVRLASLSDQPTEITLKAFGERAVTAKDFKLPPDISIANPKQLIATLTDQKAKLTLRCTVEQGRGYVPTETREREQRDIGTIALDAIFTPVERVSFTVEDIRVGQTTDYHKLLLTIATDGTIRPIDALKQAASVLRDHFSALTGDFETILTAERPIDTAQLTETAESTKSENTLSQLQLPSRVHNALERVGVTTVEQVLELTEEQIQDIPGLGQKAVTDIIKARDNYRGTHIDSGDEA